ncbi:hypothetical protein SPFM20_00182 [Salmonella phage SPFM20]|nr:hypothetical protein SPFM20_00182 [Salmonella phage SPFM20]
MDKFAFMVNRLAHVSVKHIVLTKDGKVIAGNLTDNEVLKLYPVTIDVAFTTVDNNHGYLCGQLAGMADRVGHILPTLENIYPVFAVAMLRLFMQDKADMVLTRGDEVIGLSRYDTQIVAVNLGSDVRFTIYKGAHLNKRLKTIHIEREYPIDLGQEIATESPRSPTIPKPDVIVPISAKTVAKDSMASNAIKATKTRKKQLSGITSITLKEYIMAKALYRHI